MDEIPEIKIDGNINVIFKTGKLDGVNHDEQSSSKPCTDIALIDTRKLDSETNGNMVYELNFVVDFLSII